MSSSKSLLIAGIVDSGTAEVSTAFAAGMLRFQQQLATRPNAPKTAFECFSSVKDAIEHARATNADRTILLDGSMGIDADFLLKDHPLDRVVVAAYPLREIRWDRVLEMVKHDVEHDAESIRQQSYVYNFEKGASFDGTPKECDTQSYLRCDHDVQARIACVPRSCLDEFVSRFDETSSTLRGGCLVDVSAKTTNAGPYDFVGCVLNQLVTNAV